MDERRVPSITIGADYFRTTVRKESLYPLMWRWVKETVQNSYDADASMFTVNLYTDERSAEVIDDGNGMDEDTLLDVFLSIGGSKKDTYEDYNPIGGFGDAKKVVCFCWDRWEIHTLDNYLNNELIGDHLEKTRLLRGTRIKVWMGDEFDVDIVEEYLNLCHLDMNIEINVFTAGLLMRTFKPIKLRRGKLINDIGFGKLYANKSNAMEVMIVRLNGLALFKNNVPSVKATFILELDSAMDPKSKEYILNVTREQLTWKYSMQVEKIIHDMMSNPTKALIPKKEERIVIMKGVGACESVSNSAKKVTLNISLDDYRKKFDGIPEFNILAEKHVAPIDITVPEMYASSIKSIIDDPSLEDLVAIFGHVKNNLSSTASSVSAQDIMIDIVGMNVDVRNPLQEVFPYDIIVKGTTKKRYSGTKYQKLLLAWYKTVQYVCYYNTWNYNPIDLGDYKVGFIFDDSTLAQRCTVEGYPCYLLNPSDINWQDYSWRGIVITLIDRATHEVAHNFENEHNGRFIEIWNKIKILTYMYIDDIMYDVGRVLKSTIDTLVTNANLDQVFSYEYENDDE